MAADKTLCAVFLVVLGILAVGCCILSCVFSHKQDPNKLTFIYILNALSVVFSVSATFFLIILT